MNWRSRKILERPEWSINRSLYKSMGYSDYDLEKPLIGIANSWNRVVPGHYNLNQVSEYVQQGIRQAGGTPVEFGVIAACDGIAQGHDGMHYILPTRDLIANDIEMMVEAHRLDAVVLLGSCDKIVPAMLMAAARLDLPAILVVGGPMAGGCHFDGRAADITSLTEGLGMLKAGKIEQAEEFMEQKRQFLATKGYHIRKLNQAYFAFHGAYADRPTSISPIGRELKELRNQSVSLKDFLEKAATMTSRQDLVESLKQGP